MWLTSDEIKTANNAGNLYIAIEEKLKVSDLPKANALSNLMTKKQIILDSYKFVIDESSEDAFLQTLASCLEQQPYTGTDVIGTLFARFAITRFKYVDLAEKWINSTFPDHGHISSLQADISFIKKELLRPIKTAMGKSF